jgi:hypothetical protein
MNNIRCHRCRGGGGAVQGPVVEVQKQYNTEVGWICFPLVKEEICGGLKFMTESSVTKVDLVSPTQPWNFRTLDHTAVIVTNDVSQHDVTVLLHMKSVLMP